MAKDKLFSEFQEISTEEWENLIKKDLKGADYERKLISKTIDNIRIKPYYRAENLADLDYLNSLPGEFPFVRHDNQNCEIRQNIKLKDAKTTNRKAKNALKKGATALSFICSDDIELNIDYVSTLLTDILKPDVLLNFADIKKPLQTVKLIKQVADNNKIDAEKLRIHFDFDPLGHKTRTGHSINAGGGCFLEFTETVRLAKDWFKEFKALNVRGIQFRNAGATAVQELAFSLAAGSHYLASGLNKNFKPEELLPHLSFTFGIGSHYFIEIAKLRAARLLWAAVADAYLPNHPELAKMYIHSEDSIINKTLYDAHVNLLRNTTEAMSAIIGGTDSLTLNPFDAGFAKPNDLSERLARNIPIILKEEAYLNKSIDASAGSYYIENLTDNIAQAAWNLFLKIENTGGYGKALETGFIYQEIKETARKRDMNIAFGKDKILGTNLYPNPDETISQKLTYQIKIKEPENILLPAYRGALAFEKLRLQTEALPKRPEVFLFTYGNLTMRKARAGFASGFFACAGYKIINNIGFNSLEEGIKEAKNQNPDIVVICSSDDEYPEISAQIFKALHSTSEIVIAGNPKNHLENLKNIGIKHFIHAGSNILDNLRHFNKIIKDA